MSLAVLALAMGASNAQAQAAADAFRRDRNTSVAERPKPEYAAVGVRVGGFIIYPEVAGALDHSSNVFATDFNELSDTAAVLDATVRLASNWNTDELHARFDADTRQGFEYETLDRTNWSASVGGRKDIVRGASLFGELQFGETHEELWNSGSTLPLAEPTPVSVLGADVGFARTFNRLRLGGQVLHRQRDYDDTALVGGGTVDFDLRDHQVTEVSGRIDYAISPSTALFVSAAVNSRDYDIDPPDPRTLISRDSEGQEVLAGASFDITRLVRGEVGVGYLRQDYEAAGVEDTSDVALRANIEWFPDELVTVTFAASRQIRDADVAAAVSYVSSEFGASVDYELRRNIVLGAEAGIGRDDYQGASREYERTRVALRGDYLVNRSASVFARADWYNQTSATGGGREYDIARFTVGLRLRR